MKPGLMQCNAMGTTIYYFYELLCVYEPNMSCKLHEYNITIIGVCVKLSISLVFVCFKYFSVYVCVVLVVVLIVVVTIWGKGVKKAMKILAQNKVTVM